MNSARDNTVRRSWKYDKRGCVTSHGLPIVTKANGHLVAHLCERNDANGRIIAAAPDLLAALRELVAVIGPTPARPETIGPYDRARAAIAKAEGIA